MPYMYIPGKVCIRVKYKHNVIKVYTVTGMYYSVWMHIHVQYQKCNMKYCTHQNIKIHHHASITHTHTIICTHNDTNTYEHYYMHIHVCMY